MKTKTNNQNQNTPKTKPSAENKALAKLVRTKFRCVIQDMAKLCRKNGLSFDISGWVEDPVDRGDTTEKTLKFNCGTGKPSAFLEHRIFYISKMLKDLAEKGDYDYVKIMCMLTKQRIGYACNEIMTKLNKEMKTDNI